MQLTARSPRDDRRGEVVPVLVLLDILRVRDRGNLQLELLFAVEELFKEGGERSPEEHVLPSVRTRQGFAGCAGGPALRRRRAPRRGRWPSGAARRRRPRSPRAGAARPRVTKRSFFLQSLARAPRAPRIAKTSGVMVWHPAPTRFLPRQILI